MKIILFGATGMVGSGVLRECLLDPDVESVLTVGRQAPAVSDGKLRVLIRPDMFDARPTTPPLPSTRYHFVSKTGITAWPGYSLEISMNGRLSD